MRTIALAISAVSLAGCVAANPKNIDATPTPTFAYQGLSCDQLGAEDARLAEEVGYYSYRQSRRRDQDALGIIAVGVSPSGLGGADWQAQIAQLKGQREAVRSTASAKGCSLPPASLDGSTAATIRYRDRMNSETS